jgi:hypothetical protein
MSCGKRRLQQVVNSNIPSVGRTNGVLEIEIPKREEANPRQIQVSVQADQRLTRRSKPQPR